MNKTQEAVTDNELCGGCSAHFDTEEHAPDCPNAITGARTAERVTIDEVKIEWLTDESADLSFIGEYSDTAYDYSIIRVGEHAGKFVADLDEDDRLPERSREYRYFNAYAGGEKEGTADFKKYALQDFERMESAERGNWQMEGCVAKATVSYSIGNGSRRLETLTSGGLWGIESDSDKKYLRTLEDEELADLADHLEHFGIETSAEKLREIAD